MSRSQMIRAARGRNGVPSAVRSAIASGLSIAAATLLSPAAYADDADQSKSESLVLEEIVVTAQKREERLQEVPLSIAALGQRELEQRGIASLDDLTRQVAGMQLLSSPYRAQYTIRGVTTGTGIQSMSSASGLFVDGYPLYDTWFPLSSPDPRIVDVQRVEVLRGPQGTLYGASSLSGDVRLFTNKPDLSRASASFELMGADVNGGSMDYLASAVVNAPFADGRMGLRASVWTRQDGGYIDAPGRPAGISEDVNEGRTMGARAHLKGEPNDRLTWLATVSYERNERDDQSFVYYFPPAGQSVDDWKRVSYPTPTEGQYRFASLSIDYSMGWADLNVTGMYGQNEGRYAADLGPYVHILTGRRAPIVPEEGHIDVNSDTQSFELRLASNTDGPFKYVAGAYLNKRNNEQNYRYLSDALIPIYRTDWLAYADADNDSQETAVFAQGSWAFAGTWEATLGLRYSKLDYRSYFLVSGALYSPPRPSTLAVTAIENNDSTVTPRFSIANRVSENLNLYATVSKGFRFGLTNYNTASATNVPLLYKPDSLWNYELGAKATLLDGRMSLNSALYYINWKDMQLSFRNPDTGGSVYIANAGRARSYGLEAEWAFRPTRAVELNASLALNTAEIAEDTPGIQARQASIRGPAIYGVESGMRLPGAAKVSGSAGFQYNWENAGAGDAYFRVDAAYVGSSYVDFLQEGSLEIGGYTVANLRLGYRFGNYDASLFANNILDERAISNAIPNVDALTTDAAFRVRPRTIGVMVRASF